MICKIKLQGYKMISGQSFGDKQKECEDSSDFCYNATATAGILLSPMKAGCSTYRCYLAKDTCRSIEFQVSKIFASKT